MTSASSASLGALSLLALLAGADPLELDAQRSRLADAFGVPAGEMPGLRVEVEAIENGPEGRSRLGDLEAAVFAIFAELGVPALSEAVDPGALVVSCRVGLASVAEEEVGWGLFRWQGICDVSRRGRVGLTTARAGGASHPDAEMARGQAREAARVAMVEALRRRLAELLQAPAS